MGGDLHTFHQLPYVLPDLCHHGCLGSKAGSHDTLIGSLPSKPTPELRAMDGLPRPGHARDVAEGAEQSVR